MIAKMQPAEERANFKGITKKIRCPQHHLMYAFKCEYPTCDSPFICGTVDCIQNHIHEDKIIMTRFRGENVSNKFYEVQSMITDDTMNENARVLKSYIEGLKDSIKNIYVGIKTINQNYDYLKGDLEGALNTDYIQRVQENYELNTKVRKGLDQLKEKVKLQFPLKDSYFALRSYLVEFLVQHIENFSWSKSKEIYSSKNELTTCQKFHQKLAGMRNLLFLFIGQTRIVGSFYSCRYPTLADRTAKDPNSFLFINSNTNSTRFLKFEAKQQSEQNISISQKNYINHGNTPTIGDGIRTFHKNFETLEFSLPSLTYESVDNIEETISGKLKVKRFMILQMNEQQKQQKVNGINQLD